MPVDMPSKTLLSSLLRKFERRGDTALPKQVSQVDGVRTFIDELLAEQHQLTAVERFSQTHDRHGFDSGQKHYRNLLPARTPSEGEQYNFEVDLDKCSGCKACVSACHSLNGLDEGETWRSVGLLVSASKTERQNAVVSSRIVKPTASLSFLDSLPVRSSCEEGAAFPAFEAVASDFGFQQHVTTACHHCVDPGCLNGCPVLAYEKDPVTGIVRHLDDQCMGCSYCVMKCPYEVPKYSRRLGIVRKCDMCANRLGAGEAPACVQGCPNEAIRITLVKRDDSSNIFPDRTNAQEASKGTLGVVSPFLPDSPNPRLTLPTTRYVSRRGLAERVFAADHGAPRLDPPHWPLVFMLVLTQFAVFRSDCVRLASRPAP
jgi:formate dehydrogenase iron-sulfur subunit